MGKIKKIIMPISVILLLLTSTLSGCKEWPAAGTIIARSTSALKQVNVYTIDSNDVSFIKSSDQVGEIQQWNSSKSIDLPGKQLKENLTVSETGMTIDEWTVERYVTQGLEYVKATSPSVQGGPANPWHKSKIDNETWTEETRISNLAELLKSPEKTIVMGDDYVNGTRCYLLDLTPSPQAVVDWVIWQQTGYGLQYGAMWGVGTYQVGTVRLWIEMDNYLPLRAEINALFGRFPDNNSTGSNFQGQTTLTYNQPFSIQLPQEAIDATSQ